MPRLAAGGRCAAGRLCFVAQAGAGEASAESCWRQTDSCAFMTPFSPPPSPSRAFGARSTERYVRFTGGAAASSGAAAAAAVGEGAAARGRVDCEARPVGGAGGAAAVDMWIVYVTASSVQIEQGRGSAAVVQLATSFTHPC